MSNIDNHIVKMQFNNKQFESGIKETTESLGKLKEGLKLSDSAKSLTDISDAGKKFSLAGMITGVETLSDRFSTLGIIGFTAITNLTNSALNAGKEIVSALTIDPIKTGLDEYETKMNAITTIMTNTRSKGTTLDEVNFALADLNEYADLTIYNFAEMTKNIGTFTAAGVGLEDSTAAIKGIANLAAGSGSSAQQASTAMYQLSQGLAAGSLKLQDWNSVVNAGMGGELFQTALKETAKGLGIVVDESIPFRASLQDGWVTSEVLIETLKGFTDTSTEMGKSLTDAATKVKTVTQLFDVMKESVQSGWSVSWESIIGDSAQAKETLTSISEAFGNLIAPSADARNEALAFWNAMGGRDDIIEGITNLLTSLGNILGPIGDAFREVFPRTTGEQLVEWSANFKKLTENFAFTEESGKKLKKLFKAFFSIFGSVNKVIKGLVSGFFSLVSLLPKLDFNKLINSVTEFLEMVGDKANKAITKTFEDFSDGIETTIDKFKTFSTFIKDKATNIIKALKNMADYIKEIVGIDPDPMSDSFGKMAGRLQEATSVVSIFKGMFEKLGVVLDFVKGKLDFVKDIFIDLGTAIKDSFNMTTEDFDSSTILKALGAGALGTLVVFIGKLIFWIKDLNTIGNRMLEGIIDIFEGVEGVLKAYQSNIRAGTILKIAIAIGVLAASIVALTLIDEDKMKTALGGMSILLLGLFGATGILNVIAGGVGLGAANTVILSMFGLSMAMLMLSKAIKNMGGLDEDVIDAASNALSKMMVMIAIATKISSVGDSTGMLGAAAGIIAMAIAMRSLTGTVKEIGEIDPDMLIQGMLGVTAMMALLVGFMATTKELAAFGVSAGLGIMGLSKGVKVLGEAVEDFGDMDRAELAIGVTAVGTLLTMLALTIKRMPSDMLSVGAGILLIATALVIFQKAVQEFGYMEVDELAIGLAAIAISIASVAGASKLIPVDMIPKATGIGIMAASMLLMAAAIGAFGNMDIDVIAIGLGAFIAVLGVMWLAGTFVGPLAPLLIALAGAITLIGISVALAGAGMLYFATALTLLAALGAGGVIGITTTMTAMAELVPKFMEKLAEGVISFAKAIRKGIPELMLTVKEVLLAFLKTISDTSPEIIKTTVELIMLLLTTARDKLPEMQELGYEILISLLEGAEDSTEEVTETAIGIVLAFIAGVTEKMPEIIDAGFDLVIAFIDGFAGALDENSEPLITAAIKLMNSVKSTIKLILERWYPHLKREADGAWDAMLEALATLAGKLKKKFKEALNDTIDEIGDLEDDFKTAGRNLVKGLLAGVTELVGNVKKAGGNLAYNVLMGAKKALKIDSPSKEFKQIGIYTGEGLIQGINSMGKKVMTAGTVLGRNTLDSVANALNKVKELTSEGFEVDPTIRPLVDLSGVRTAQEAISEMLSSEKVITTKSAMAKVQSISQLQELKQNSQNGSHNESNVEYKFEQNNYSPKALSRFEIYRQTKNQIERLRPVL